MRHPLVREGAKTLKMTRCESIKTTIHKWRLVYAGGRGTAKRKEGLPSRVVFGTIASGEILDLAGSSIRLGIDA